jgi:CBS domain-containing protein
MKITEVTVEEFTSPSPITTGVEASLDEALALMQEHRIRHLPVMKDTKIVGVISERDLLTHMGRNWARTLMVEDIMNTSLLTVYVNDNLGEVAFQLSQEKKGSALVLDLEGDLYGIFTTTDALNALVEIVYPECRTRGYWDRA